MIELNRVQGSKGLSNVECINSKINRWRVRWDMQEYSEERDEHTIESVTFVEWEFQHKPTYKEVFDLINLCTVKATEEELNTIKTLLQ